MISYLLSPCPSLTQSSSSSCSFMSNDQTSGHKSLEATTTPLATSVTRQTTSTTQTQCLEKIGTGTSPSPNSGDSCQHQPSPSNSNGFYDSTGVPDNRVDITGCSPAVPAPIETVSWGYSSLCGAAYPCSAVKPEPSPTLNGEYASTLSAANNSMFSSGVTDSYSDSAKNLFQSAASVPSLTTQYYNSAVYNGQSLPYGVQNTAALYGTHPVAAQQTYYARLKGTNTSLPTGYALNPYFGTASATPPAYYGGTYPATQSTFDYTSAAYAAAAYPSVQYYGSSYGNPVTTTTATYQLTQLPPCTSLAGGSDDSNVQYSLNDLSPFSTKTEGKKPKGKKKKQANPSPSPEGQFERVFVWDLDDTCVIFHSLVSGAYAAKFGKDATASVTLGFRMEEMILAFAEANFFMSELEDCDQVHIDDVTTDDTGQDLTGYGFTGEGFHLPPGAPPALCLSSPAGMRGGVDWMRKLAFRYRRIRDLYNMYKDNISALVGGMGKVEQWLQLRSDIETLTDNWTGSALKCLELASIRPRYANVLVSSSPLIPTLAKVLLYGLGPVFPIENIYSANKIGREACFERIQNRFGKKTTYVVVGSGRDEEAASKQLQMPFWRITSQQDLQTLHYALDLGHL